MELQKFISESIKQICLGIKQAQEEIMKVTKNFPIAPAHLDGEKVYGKPEEICFDIAVTISQDSKLNAAGDIKIYKVASGNVSGETSEKKENIHKINIKIPFYPQLLTIPYYDLQSINTDNK